MAGQIPIWKSVLLWIAVLPGAAAGGMLGVLAHNFIMWYAPMDFCCISTLDWVMTPWKYLAFALKGAMFASFFTIVGTAIAPTHRLHVAMSLGAIMLLLAGAAGILHLVDQNWQGITEIAGMAIGTVLVLVKVHDTPELHAQPEP